MSESTKPATVSNSTPEVADKEKSDGTNPAPELSRQESELAVQSLARAIAKSMANEPEETKVETKTVDVEFVRLHELDPQRQLPQTATYLDQVQREESEIARARVEGGRKPDLKDPPANAGTPYTTKAALEATLPAHAKVEGHVTLPVVVTV